MQCHANYMPHKLMHTSYAGHGAATHDMERAPVYCELHTESPACIPAAAAAAAHADELMMPLTHCAWSCQRMQPVGLRSTGLPVCRMFMQGRCVKVNPGACELCSEHSPAASRSRGSPWKHVSGTLRALPRPPSNEECTLSPRTPSSRTRRVWSSDYSPT